MPVRSRVRALLLLALCAASAAGALDGEAASATARAKPWLWQCERISREEAKQRCALRLLYLRVNASADPARELPRIDRDARLRGESLAGSCHVLMHEVGRRYAREHGVTLGTLQRYIPRSNDPTCSAGFGMGLVMQLGPRIAGSGGRSALRTCLRLPTRYRSYTCVHGLGHALMRGFHGNLRAAVSSCRALGPANGPDCAQGAFHDYWISLHGGDGTTRPRRPDTSPRSVCNGHLWYVRPCWYRYFIEQPLSPVVEDAADVRRLCRGLRPLQRAGCVAAASLAGSADPFEQTRLCSHLSGRDARACVRGVVVQALTRRPGRQRALLASCREIPGGARGACYSWFGRTLNVITDGRFLSGGCRSLATSAARRACSSGARRTSAPLLTFS